MRYEIDQEATVAVGATLFSSDVALRAATVAAGNAGGLARYALADHDEPRLREAVDSFVRAHVAVIEMAAAASGVLARKLNLAAQSAHEVEVSTAAELGASGHFAPTGVPLTSFATELEAPSSRVMPTGS